LLGVFDGVAVGCKNGPPERATDGIDVGKLVAGFIGGEFEDGAPDGTPAVRMCGRNKDGP